jgi:hypothetical protein
VWENDIETEREREKICKTRVCMPGTSRGERYVSEPIELKYLKILTVERVKEGVVEFNSLPIRNSKNKGGWI